MKLMDKFRYALWEDTDDTVGDNYGSFINGAKSDAAKNYWFKKFNLND